MTLHDIWGPLFQGTKEDAFKFPPWSLCAKCTQEKPVYSHHVTRGDAFKIKSIRTVLVSFAFVLVSYKIYGRNKLRGGELYLDSGA